MNQSSLYQYVIVIAEDYFGPAAHRVIDRLVANHLHKSPTDLKTKDLPELIAWSRLAVAMVTDDQTVVEEFTRRIECLKAPAPLKKTQV
jgi:hypothetical protein